MRVLPNLKDDLGKAVDIHFSDYGIVPGVFVAVECNRGDAPHPRKFKGQVEIVYPGVCGSADQHRLPPDDSHVRSDLLFHSIIVCGRAATARVLTVAPARQEESRRIYKVFVSAGQ